MNLNDYQTKAAETILGTAKNDSYLLLGLVGEVGELMSMFAKERRDGKGWEYDLFVKELGDILWFVAMLAEQFHVSLEDVAHLNLDKLSSRRERGTLSGSGDNR